MRGCPEIQFFHSNRGSSYTSDRFLYIFAVNQSFSRSGCPYDNAVVESFFSYLKREEINRHDFSSVDELEKAIDSYIEYYNDFRPHEGLGQRTPNETEAIYYKELNDGVKSFV